MRALWGFTFMSCIAFPGAVLALSCEMTPFDEYAVRPDTPDWMIVLGEVDENFVFDGVIVSSDEPIRLQMTRRFRDPPHPVWGGPTLPTDRPVLGPVVRVDDDRFAFIGNLCGLTLISPTDENIERVRQCQRDGRCPE